MKLLIKIYFEEINPYDLLLIVDDLYSNVVDKDSTTIYIMINNSDFTFEYDFCYINETNIPKVINYNLDNLEWDIILPIFKPCITTTYGFDLKIKEIYKKKFPKFDGVLWLNDGVQKDINIYPVIGRKYYEKTGFIYNSIYKKKNFENEFTEIMKFSVKYYFVKDIYFKSLMMKSDDDNIYNMRKKFNFLK